MSVTPSGSKADLLSLCRAPLALESIKSTNEAAEIGAYIHDLIAEELCIGPVARAGDLIDAPTKAVCNVRAGRAAKWFIETFAAGRLVEEGEANPYGKNHGGEETFWLDPVSLELCEEKDGAIRVTPDLWKEGQTVLTCIDWKTGRNNGIDPNESMQLALQGYATWKFLFNHGRRYHAIVVGYAYISDSGDVHFHRSATKHPLELLSLVRTWSELVSTGDREPHPGMHCKALYCPSISTCPAVDKVTEQVIPLGALTGRQVQSTGIGVVEAFQIDSPDKLMRALEIQAFAKKRLEELGSAIKGYAEPLGEVHLPDGKRYRQVVSRRSTFDKSKAFETYPALAGEEFHRKQEVTSWKVTK